MLFYTGSTRVVWLSYMFTCSEESKACTAPEIYISQSRLHGVNEFPHRRKVVAYRCRKIK